jgi:TonB-dependent receptor
MLDLPFYLLGEQFRLVGGARVEDNVQTVMTKNADAPPTPSKIDTLDVLPSANFTWMFSEKINVRLGYYKSVNRPEFREMSDVLYFNFNEGYLVRGNPNLKRAVIQNFDVRLEWFPNPGEVIAVSYFYKDIEKAIEVKLRDSPERALRTWFNAPDGRNQGFELELRKSLGFVHRYANNFSFLVNYTRVESEVKYEELINVDGNLVPTEKSRPLQGQAPWMFNTGFFFYEPTIKTSFSLLYNRIGRRLDVVADEEELNVYEEPRHQLDLALTQILGRFKTKFTIENMLGEESVYTIGNTEDVDRQHTNPTRYSLSLSFDL